jgi:hypothetical protein
MLLDHQGDSDEVDLCHLTTKEVSTRFIGAIGLSVEEAPTRLIGALGPWTAKEVPTRLIGAVGQPERF